MPMAEDCCTAGFRPGLSLGGSRGRRSMHFRKFDALASAALCQKRL